MLRWGAGIILAAFLAGGGIAWAVSGGPTTQAAGTSAANSTQGLALNSALNTAGSTVANVPLPRIRRALARLRALGGLDGGFTFPN
jgi:hypothetical protein